MSLLSWCHRLVSCNFLVSALFESAKTQLRLDLAQQRSLGAALTRCRLKQHILDYAPPGPKAVPGLEAAWTRDLAPPARRRDSAPLRLAPPPGLAAAWIWQRLSQHCWDSAQSGLGAVSWSRPCLDSPPIASTPWGSRTQ